MPNKCPWQMIDEEGKVFEPESHPLRSDIPAPPAQMEHLPISQRGYPVPFFVSWLKHQPEFRGSSRQAVLSCIQRHICWVCGMPLGHERVFVIGPMCSVNRISAEPPCHIACARYSVQACPFLSKPQMVRREDGLPEDREFGAGVALKHNPGVTLLWFAKTFNVEPYPEGYLFHFTSAPFAAEWWTMGRKATRQEVLDAFHRGLPLLRESAAQENALDLLDAMTKTAMRLLPKE